MRRVNNSGNFVSPFQKVTNWLFNEAEAADHDGRVDQPVLHELGHVLVLEDDDDGRNDEEDDAGDEHLHDVEVLAHLLAGQEDVAQKEAQECRRNQEWD